MSKLSNMIGLAKKVLDSQSAQQQQQGSPQGGSTGQRSWQSTLQDVAAAVGGRNQAAQAPAHEQPRSSDVADLSRAAARTEARRPGSMRSVLAKVGTGGAVAGAAVGAVGVLGVVAAGAAVSSVAGPLLANAANLGVDFDALASGVDVEGLTSSLGDVGAGALDEATAGVGDLAGWAEGAVSGLGDQISEAGQPLSDLAEKLDPRNFF